MNAESNYPTIFNKILDFKENSQLTDLLDPIKKPPLTVTNGLLNTVSVVASHLIYPVTQPAFTKKHQKKLYKKLDQLCEYLNSELEENRYDSERLKNLKIIAQKIFNNKIEHLIKQKLREQNIYNKKLLVITERFNKRIMNILSTPEISNLSTTWNCPIRNFSHHPSPLSLTGVSASIFMDKKDFTIFNEQKELLFTRINADDQIKESKTTKNRLIKENIFERFKSLIPQKQENWSKALMEEFSLLENHQEISILAKMITPIQILEIIQLSIKNETCLIQISCLMFSLPYESLALVLEALDPSTLKNLNKIFFQQDIKKFDWIEKLFKKQRKLFVHVSNSKNEAINSLDAKFRDEIDREAITEEDIEDIFNLKKDIVLHREIFKKYRLMIEDVFHDSETIRLIIGKEQTIAELEMEYNVHLKRLSESDEEMQEVRGCPFGIIYRRVFEDEDCSDEQEAYEIFSSWGICFLEEWRQIGLFGNISHEEFENFTQDLKSGHGKSYAYAAEKMAEMGIKTIKDWKRLHIYNKNMLSNFLKKHTL